MQPANAQPWSVATYFFQVVPGGPVKIGRSKDVAKRYADVKGFMPYPVAFRLVLPGDHEAALHFAYRQFRLNGEWFRPASPLSLLLTTLPIDQRITLVVANRRIPVAEPVSKVEMAAIVRRLLGARVGKRAAKPLRSTNVYEWHWLEAC